MFHKTYCFSSSFSEILLEILPKLCDSYDVQTTMYVVTVTKDLGKLFGNYEEQLTIIIQLLNLLNPE